MSEKGRDTEPIQEALQAAYAGSLPWPAFYKLFLASTLYLPTESEVPGETGWRVSERGERFAIPLLSTAGATSVPAFSSLRELERYATSHGQAYVRMHAVDLLRQLEPTQGLFLDLAGEFPKEFSPEEVQEMLALSTQGEPVLRAAGTRFSIGPPAAERWAITTLLRAILVTLPEIREAYLAEISFPDTGEPPHLLIGVRFADRSFPRTEAILEKLHLALAPLLAEGEIVDFTVIGDPTSAPDYFLTESTPFYRAEA